MSDRLVSRSDTPFDPAANKTIVLFTVDGVVSLSYTGSAYIGGLPTDEWLVQAIIQADVPRHDGHPVMRFGGLPRLPNVGRAMERITSALNEAHRSGDLDCGAAASPFGIAVTGWQWKRTGRERPVLYALHQSPSLHFARRNVAPRHPQQGWYSTVVPFGNVLRADYDTFRQAIRAAGDSNQVESAAISLVRDTSTAHPGRIGPVLMSVSIPEPRNAAIGG